MKINQLFFFLAALMLLQCHQPAPKKTGIEAPDFSAISQVDSGTAVSVMLTAYSTTLLANGVDKTRLRIAVTDSLNREITSANDSVRLFVAGDGKVTGEDGIEPVLKTDTAGNQYASFRLEKGICNLFFVAGKTPDKIKVEAKVGKLWPGAHEIHTLSANFAIMKPTNEQLPATTKNIDNMIGADISFLPQIEDRGMKFSENGKEIDAITLLKNHGFNYIRLRIFVNPENEKGYAPGKGYCGLNYTLAMAKRVKEAGLKLLLDFHYSDYWADPQQQYKPYAWQNLSYETLKDSVRTYTSRILSAFRNQGTLPDMVQIGNEINHGMLWPDGHIGNPDQLAGLLQAGVDGVENVDAGIPVMMHIALGGQNEEAVFWLDNVLARNVKFDIIGLSYYPRWHGTPGDLYSNLHNLLQRYNKPLNVVEYSDFKKEVHDIVFGLPDEMGKGACIWEPLGWRSGIFDRSGEVNEQILVYDELKKVYLSK